MIFQLPCASPLVRIHKLLGYEALWGLICGGMVEKCELEAILPSSWATI